MPLYIIWAFTVCHSTRLGLPIYKRVKPSTDFFCWQFQGSASFVDPLQFIVLCGAFHLRTSVYLLRTLIPSFAHDSAYHLRTLFTPPCSLVVICWERADLLALLYIVFFFVCFFCQFPKWCSVSCMVLDCKNF